MAAAQKTHLGVYAVIIFGEKILLIHKSRGPYKEKLDLPGGRLEFGEDILTGIKREVDEETGLTVTEIEGFSNETLVIDFKDLEEGLVQLHHIGLIYKVEVADKNALQQTIAFEDVTGSGWYNLTSLDLKSLSPFAQRVVNKLLSSKN